MVQGASNVILAPTKNLAAGRKFPGPHGGFPPFKEGTSYDLNYYSPSTFILSFGQTTTHHSFHNLQLYFQNSCHTHYLLLSWSIPEMAAAATTTGTDFLKSGLLDGNPRRIVSSSEETAVDLDEDTAVASVDGKGKDIDVSINGQSANRPNIIDLDDPTGGRINQTSPAFDLSPRAILAQAVDTATFLSMVLYLGKLASIIPSAAAAGQGWLWPTLFITAKTCNYCKIISFILLNQV